VGANDACLPGGPSGQHIPLEEYRQNLNSILSHISRKKNKPKILLATPPPINEVHLEAGDLEKGCVLTRHQSVTAEYASAVREIAAEFKHDNVVLIDLWKAFTEEAIRLTPDYVDDGLLLGSKEKGDSEGFRHLLVDGLHLTAEGYKLFLKEVLPHVGTEWAQEDPEFPSWPLL
jgi:lysophospholipase L1-like esterase